MILSELRDYLQRNGRASLMHMAYHFDTEPDALRGMLDRLIAKGRVQKLPPAESPCSGCSKCDQAQAEIYQWRGRPLS